MIKLESGKIEAPGPNCKLHTNHTINNNVHPINKNTGEPQRNCSDS